MKALKQQTECVKQKLDGKFRGDQAHMGWIQSLGMEIVPNKERFDISCPLELGCTQSRCIKAKYHNQMKYM